MLFFLIHRLSVFLTLPFSVLRCVVLDSRQPVFYSSSESSCCILYVALFSVEFDSISFELRPSEVCSSQFSVAVPVVFFSPEGRIKPPSSKILKDVYFRALKPELHPLPRLVLPEVPTGIVFPAVSTFLAAVSAVLAAVPAVFTPFC